MNCVISEYVISEGKSYIEPDIEKVVNKTLKVYESKFVNLEVTKYVASFFSKEPEKMLVEHKNKRFFTQNLIYLAHHIMPDTKEVLDIISSNHTIYYKIKIEALNKSIYVDKCDFAKYIFR